MAGRQGRGRVSLVCSYSGGRTSQKRFRRLLGGRFESGNMRTVFSGFCLSYGHFNRGIRVRRVNGCLRTLGDGPVRLIVTVKSRTARSLLSAQRPLLCSIPIMTYGIRFPSRSLLGGCRSEGMCTLESAPSFGRGVRFVESLRPRINLRVICGVSLAPLNRGSFSLLGRIISEGSMRVLKRGSTFSVRCRCGRVERVVRFCGLVPTMTGGQVGGGRLAVDLYPFQCVGNTSLLMVVRGSGDRRKGGTFLLSGFSVMSFPVIGTLDVPSFDYMRTKFKRKGGVINNCVTAGRVSIRTTTSLSAQLVGGRGVNVPGVESLEGRCMLS